MIDCDFIPSGYHHARSRHRTLQTRLVFIGLLLVIMGVWFGLHRQEIASADGMMADVTQQRQQIEQHVANRQAMLEKNQQLQARLQLIEQLGDRCSLVLLLADIGRRLPDTVVLTRISLKGRSELWRAGEAESGGRNEAQTVVDLAVRKQDAAQPGGASPAAQNGAAPLQSSDGARAELTIEGVARSTPDILEFTAALESSSLLDRVHAEVKGPGHWAGRRVQRFELSCEPVRQGVTP